ncbi:MAG: hypothetical protein JJT89_00320 [Nitriliruptoraceae bacterium]|nr:hypothetical protein [Nitriliruptoraceae bacterium]
MDDEPGIGPTPPDLQRPEGWQAMRAALPEIARLVSELSLDRRVPVHAKVVAAAAISYALLPLGRTRIGRLPGISRGFGLGADDVVVAWLGVRYLIAAAGYDLVRERWRGTDGAFAWLVVVAGIDG